GSLLLAARDLLHIDARLRADVFHGVHEIEAEPLLHEGEDVTLLVADEAHVSAARRHREVGILPLMERARAPEAVAHALELHQLTHDGDDVGLFADALDDVVRDHPRVATVTPAPPSFHAPNRNSRTRVSFLSISVTRS